MVKKKGKAATKGKKGVYTKEEDKGVSLDDAFGDDDGVAYAVSKEKKTKKHKGMSEDELDEELDVIERSNGSMEAQEYLMNASKPVAQLKKGDSIIIDGKKYEVDSHYVLIDHGSTKEMAIELFDAASDKDYQLRYFDDQVETTFELYELQEIMYIKKPFKAISW